MTMLFAAMHESVVGTKRTWRDVRLESVMLESRHEKSHSNRSSRFEVAICAAVLYGRFYLRTAAVGAFIQIACPQPTRRSISRERKSPARLR
jgi:hypothetical protein